MSELSQQKFREGFRVREGGNSTPHAVCVQLAAEEILEGEEDGLELEDYLERSQLVVDGSPVTHDATPHMDLLGVLQVEKEDEVSGESRIIHSNAVGPFTVCWQVPLAAGLHTAEFRTNASSGKQFTYQWEFHITD